MSPHDRPKGAGVNTPRILTIDIETSPNVADVWGLFKQTVSLSQLRESTRMISFAAKWRGTQRVEFRSEFHDGRTDMIERARALLDEADIVVHYNGTTFDMPHMRREFLLEGITPPSPVKQVDLLRTVKKQFRFSSNKLDHVTAQLGLTGKLSHSGHDLWVRCMAGDEKAWALMRRYNKRDVVTTEELYDRLLPWITAHPHVGLYRGDTEDTCPKCGSTRLERRGWAYTTVSAFRQYRCKDCGGWSRSGKRSSGTDLRPVH